MEPGQLHVETLGTGGEGNDGEMALSIMESAIENMFSHLCLNYPLFLCCLMCARAVSRACRASVDKALLLLPHIAFPVRVTGPDVLAMLMRVAGANLKTVCLEGCRQLSAVDIGRILADLAARCPAVIEVNLTDCGEEAILRALAVCAQKTFAAVSPADLRAMLLALVEEEGASRCPLELLLGQITSPRLRVADEGQGFVPGRDALRKAVECAIGEEQEQKQKQEEEEEETDEMQEERVEASVYDDAAVFLVALLLACTFSADQDEEIVSFDCNRQIGRGKRAIHLVAESGGPASLLSLLTLAGADVNAKDDVSFGCRSVLREGEGVRVSGVGCVCLSLCEAGA